MLKEVGASGQISLGKKYAGQLFDMTVRPDGSIVMQPVKVVPMTTQPATMQEELAAYAVPLVSPAAPGDALATQEWAEVHSTEIAQYNAWVTQREPYSQRVRRWREQGQSESVLAAKS